MRTFYLGVEAAWIARPEFAGVPMFVTYAALADKKRLAGAVGPVAIDSGGYTQLSKPPHRWTTTPAAYADGLVRIAETVGPFDFAVAQDVMCTPDVLTAAGLTVAEAQTQTIDRFLDLAWRVDHTIAPVIQGWSADDYARHVDDYRKRGIDLTEYPVVTVGSLAARSRSTVVESIVARLHGMGLDNLHGLGMKVEGLRRCWPMLDRADSHAWSFAARRRFYDTGRPMFDDCTHARCNHCPRWALAWRADVLAATRRPVQLGFAV